MSSKYQIFDAARMELEKGINLVEASAGTGKTYAIGMLVLRALVELHVPIEKILIVTFTKAATEELKSRIRARLVEARNLFDRKEKNEKNEISEKNTDQTLLDWASTINDREKALNRLQLALYDIDRAGIFTIHGFCQRMLVEQALESGQLFDVELLTDINHVRGEVADDFWRNQIYSLEPLPCSLVTRTFATPEKLMASVSGVFGGGGTIEPLVGPLEEVLKTLDSSMARLISWWPQNSTRLGDCFAASLDEGSFKKGFSEDFESWFQSLDDFFSGKTHVIPEKIELLGRASLTDELNGTKIRGEAKKLAHLADFPLPDNYIEELVTAIDSLLLTIRVLLAQELRAEVSRRLEQQGTMGFNDLILRLSAALKGARGSDLKRILNERFSVALIDEFQDTDNAQWHIFSTLFGGSSHYLYLIGDPKQAIYKFRGADIYSYFLARESATCLLTLEKNYRSHPFLVDEVNDLFSKRPDPFFLGQGVLDYHTVLAAKKEHDIDLSRGDESLSGMTYCTLEPNEKDKKGRWSSGQAATEFRRFVISEIGQLLGSDVPVVVKSEEEKPLAPKDIAILVRSNSQAEQYRQALADAAIPAVVGSRRSVFQTDECWQLLLLLLAIASPGEIGKLKSALTIPWFGFTGNTLHDLWQDDERVSEYHGRFLGYNQLWQEQGVLGMMSRLLVDEEVFITLAPMQMAERAIANIQHLLELIQEQESSENLGIGQVLQWLQAMMNGDKGADNAELLLESDEEAVRIVTMHSAKGLEYAVVFCPYLWYRSKRTSSEKYQITSHDDANELVVDLGSEQFEERREKAVLEEMAEDLRLLYVALTRAKIRCYTMWADVKPRGSVGDSFQSALGYLLFPDGYLDYQAQQEKFSDLGKKKSASHLTVCSDDLVVPALRGVQEDELKPLSASARSLHTDWQMSSFSAMASLSEYDHEHVTEITSVAGSDPVPVTGLPAGPNFGNVIHDLLEVNSFSSIAGQDNQRALTELLRQKCLRYGVEAELADMQKLLELVVTTPLVAENKEPEEAFTLANIPDTSCLKEMGFYFHLSRLATDRINTILAAEPTVTPLGYKVMRGYLTGFVDLICESRGKYYILDYKTNFLGEMMTDYGPDNLIAAMQSHNYGLQYWIYTLVLHRHLQNLLPDYSYQKNFGGVMYLFVRGMSPDIPGSGVFATLPDYDKLMELDQAIGGAENE